MSATDILLTDHQVDDATVTPSKTEENGNHFLRRWQKWDSKTYTWLPHDPSTVESEPVREDVHNYFYVNVRYMDVRAKPNVVLSDFSSTLIDFFRSAIGDEFFNSSPEYPLLRFFPRITELNDHLSKIRTALSSDQDPRDIAKSMGRPDAGAQAQESSQSYLQDLAVHLAILMEFVEVEFLPVAGRLKLQLSYGHIGFDLLTYYFEKGAKYYANTGDELMGFVLVDATYGSDIDSYDLVKNTVMVRGRGLEWDGVCYAERERTYSISPYQGTKPLSQLPCVPMSAEVEAKLIERGRLYAALSGVHYKSYDGRRIMVDRQAYDYQGGGYTRSPDGVPTVPEEDIYLLPATVYGFDLRNKTWETYNIERIGPIAFDENAWDHLVLEESTKNMIKGLVDVNKYCNTSRKIMTDVITGKGGGLIAVLHGPPGTGKTLTAEAVAEHLQRPLYTISSLELSTNPSTLEHKLSQILSLATAWDAVLLIDEADVFLEQRSLHELERNALVSVALRTLEYHRGVLFLTTNRIQTFDHAFLSRFSIAIKYPDLDQPARLSIWRKFFALAGCHLWGSDGGSNSPDDGYVRLDGQEPQCYVSLADLEELSLKPFNGRTIKNLVRTAQALALSSNEPLALDHVKVVVQAQEKFLTEFAQIHA
ncbi:P-loop containing nucleoside triphosphate hydrolase protein [Leucogyrophana mollusca]|uniref:P-loop containing nucleoside triphosphate hydrolase protein n=1 Tax=Leucogyrophana mollusca TaxID=85980 RepID=A0ACB8C1T9_9AGAM|nr:P-loop containing nucleoside triphosphate hydrolase protein [Leucogyrophana mollusca]